MMACGGESYLDVREGASFHFDLAIVADDLYLIANGLTGEPTAPVMGSAGATNMNS